MSTRPVAILSLRRRLAALWLLLALAVVPLLGRMHQVVHGPASVHAAGQPVRDTLHALFAGHGHADCQVLDQQTLGGPWSACMLPLAQALPQQAPAWAPAAAPALRRLAPFQARAPPIAG